MMMRTVVPPTMHQISEGRSVLASVSVVRQHPDLSAGSQTEVSSAQTQSWTSGGNHSRARFLRLCAWQILQETRDAHVSARCAPEASHCACVTKPRVQDCDTWSPPPLVVAPSCCCCCSWLLLLLLEEAGDTSPLGEGAGDVEVETEIPMETAASCT